MRSRYLFSLAVAAGLVACGDEPAKPDLPPVPIQGVAIDGSEDSPKEEPAPLELTGVAGDGSEGSAEEEPVWFEPEPTEPSALPPLNPDGPTEISFWDLSLYELDVDAMLDAMLHPEEYTEEEREELAFPEEIARYDDREVVVTGYMIPGEMIVGNVRDFMMVRDLLGCCFGAQPMPDEWIDVVMHPDSDARYYQYVPIRVTGTLTLGGEQDKAGFARGVYKLEATLVQEPD